MGEYCQKKGRSIAWLFPHTPPTPPPNLIRNRSCCFPAADASHSPAAAGAPSPRPLPPRAAPAAHPAGTGQGEGSTSSREGSHSPFVTAGAALGSELLNELVLQDCLCGKNTKLWLKPGLRDSGVVWGFFAWILPIIFQVKLSHQFINTFFFPN